MHRNNPILLGAVPAVPPDDDSFYRGTYRSGAVWNQLEAAGVPEVKGVWAHAAGGSRLWLTGSIKQQYAGHAQQAGPISPQFRTRASPNPPPLVVCGAIYPAHNEAVGWGTCSPVYSPAG